MCREEGGQRKDQEEREREHRQSLYMCCTCEMPQSFERFSTLRKSSVSTRTTSGENTWCTSFLESVQGEKHVYHLTIVVNLVQVRHSQTGS